MKQTRRTSDKKLERTVKELSLIPFMIVYWLWSLVKTTGWCLFMIGVLMDECWFENQWPWERLK